MPDDLFQSPKGEPSIGKGERRTVPRYPFARQTRIRLTIYHGNKVFNAFGKVIYVLPNMGMGVVFTKVEPQEMQVLLAWLRECAGSPPTT